VRVARMGENRNAYKILVGASEGKIEILKDLYLDMTPILKCILTK